MNGVTSYCQDALSVYNSLQPVSDLGDYGRSFHKARDSGSIGGSASSNHVARVCNYHLAIHIQVMISREE